MSESKPQNSQSFDWEDLRQQFAAIDAPLGELDAAPLEVMQQIWARRAAQLAQIPVEEKEGGQIELVLVLLGQEVYGLKAPFVSDIKPAEQITRVPRVPAWVAGVTNLRGRILSVIDLQHFFGLSRGKSRDLSQAEGNGNGMLVVVEGAEMEVALLVDEVLAVEVIPASSAQDPSSTTRGLPAEYVQGVADWNGSMEGDSLLVIIDLPAMLTDERLIVREDVI